MSWPDWALAGSGEEKEVVALSQACVAWPQLPPSRQLFVSAGL
jgi:hypothetical protein